MSRWWDVRAALTLLRLAFQVSLQVINCWKRMQRSNYNNQAVCGAVWLLAAVCKTAFFGSQLCQIRIWINFQRLQENNYAPLEDFPCTISLTSLNWNIVFVDAEHEVSLEKQKKQQLCFISLHVGPKESTVLYKMSIYNHQCVYVQEEEKTSSFSLQRDSSNLSFFIVHIWKK